MPGLFDALETILGRPSPVDQIARGEIPGMPAGGPPVAAGGPGQGGGPAGAPPAAAGSPQQPPLPKNLTSPPDLNAEYQQLASPAVYAQMVQRQMANDNFNRALGGFISSLSPASQRAGIQQQWSGMGTPDAGALMGNLMRMQQWNYQMRQQQAFEGAVPDLAKQWGMSPDEIRAIGPDAAKLVLQTKLPPEFARNYSYGANQYAQDHAGDVDPATGQPLGFAGALKKFHDENPFSTFLLNSMPQGPDPTLARMRVEGQQWQAKNLGEPLPARFTDPGAFNAFERAQGTASEVAANLDSYDHTLTDLRTRVTNLTKNPDDLKAIANAGSWAISAARSGFGGAQAAQWAKSHGIDIMGGGLTQGQVNLLRDADDLARGDDVTALRAANPKLAQDIGPIAAGLSTLNRFEGGGDQIVKNATNLIQNIDRARAGGYGAANVEAPDEVKQYVNDRFLPGGDGFVLDAKKMSAQQIADAKQMMAAVDRGEYGDDLKGKGRQFVIKHWKQQLYDTSQL